MHFRVLDSSPPRRHDTDVALAARATPVGSRLHAVFTFALCLTALSWMACDSDAEATCQGDVGTDCPATYDDALTAPLTCQSYERIAAGHCMTDGPLTLTRNWGTHQSNCFYDSTSHKLIGANVANDTKTYCNGTSDTMSSGALPFVYPNYCLISSAERTMDCHAAEP